MSRRAQKVPCPPFYTRNGPEGEPYPRHPDDVLNELEERFWTLDRLAYGVLLAAETGNENDAVGDHVMIPDVAHAIEHHAGDLCDAATAIRAWIDDRASSRQGAA